MIATPALRASGSDQSNYSTYFLLSYNYTNAPMLSFNSDATGYGDNSINYNDPLVSGTLNASGAVPEPASWALMLAGPGLVGGAMRSRRKSAVSFS